MKKSEFRFLFIERDPANLEQLKKELASRTLPKGIYVDPHCSDAFAVLDEIVKKTKGLAPAFVFVDPYGFNRLSANPRRWQDLQNDIRPELWREPHLNNVIRELRKQGIIEGTDYEGSFSAKANPLLRLRD